MPSRCRSLTLCGTARRRRSSSTSWRHCQTWRAVGVPAQQHQTVQWALRTLHSCTSLWAARTHLKAGRAFLQWPDLRAPSPTAAKQPGAVTCSPGLLLTAASSQDVVPGISISQHKHAAQCRLDCLCAWVLRHQVARRPGACSSPRTHSSGCSYPALVSSPALPYVQLELLYACWHVWCAVLVPDRPGPCSGLRWAFCNFKCVRGKTKPVLHWHSLARPVWCMLARRKAIHFGANGSLQVQQNQKETRISGMSCAYECYCAHHKLSIWVNMHVLERTHAWMPMRVHAHIFTLD